MEDLKLLEEYQGLEEKESELLKRLKSLPQAILLRTMKTEIEDEQKKLRVKKDESDALKQKIKELETVAVGFKTDLDDVISKLYDGEISNLKELESMNVKKDSIEKQLTKVDDQLITLMEKLEEVKVIFNEKNEALKSKKEEFRQLLKEYHDEQGELKNQLTMIPNLKANLSTQIDTALLKEYNVKKEKIGKNAIVAISKQTCQGCFMTVSFEVLKKLRAREGIVCCDKCGRILINLEA